MLTSKKSEEELGSDEYELKLSQSDLDSGENELGLGEDELGSDLLYGLIDNRQN